MKRVFLGGTTNESPWREKLIKMLDIDYFNPVVDNWDEKAYQNELKERELCDYVLYVITPRMTGVYSIAEAVDDSHKKPESTIFCVIEKDTNDTGTGVIKFDYGQMKSLDKVGWMIYNNGGKYYRSLVDVANYLND